jgi:tRNA (guanine37-N1)-methyltransferase
MAPLHFAFVTLFPDVFPTWLDASIPGRARARGLFDYTTYNLRQFGLGKHRSVDDVAFGGGGGMVLRVEPLVAAVEHVRRDRPDRRWTVVLPTPAGKLATAERLGRWLAPLATESMGFLFVCGHYEGVDERFVEGWVDETVSLGDFVVTGGELPALCLADALLRLVPGALGERAHGAVEESFSLRGDHDETLLEYPQYTRPREFRGRAVPDVLLGGDHGAIERWRREASVARTRRFRPDLLPPAP